MLLKKQVLDGIQTGRIDLAFRRWKRPTVRTGGTLRTGAGMIRIDSAAIVDPGQITEEDAARAGLALVDLLEFLQEKEEGDVYRVEIGGFAPDPRVALRQDDQLSDEDLAELTSRLVRLDRSGRHWTRRTLTLIANNPHVRAQDHAESLSVEKDEFKSDVRKLKALGLAISHSPGYELSPRGRTALSRLQESDGL